MDSCRRIERSDANGSSSVALSSECVVYWCTDALEFQLHRLTDVPAKIRTFGRTSARRFPTPSYRSNFQRERAALSAASCSSPVSSSLIGDSQESCGAGMIAVLAASARMRLRVSVVLKVSLQ